MPNKSVDIIRPDTASVDLKLSSVASVNFSLTATPSVNVTVKNTDTPLFAPVINGVPTVSGVIRVGQTLTANAVSVSANPASTRVFRWERSDNGTTGWTTIQDSSTYTIQTADELKYIRVAQRETNSQGTTIANSASTSQVPAYTFLLDSFATNVSTAFSLRKLRASYSGNCIQVTKNGSDFENIGFSNNVLDTSSLQTFAGSDSVYVSKIYDQSGTGSANNLEQSSFSAMPKIWDSSSGLITRNNNPSIEMDGSSFLEMQNEITQTDDLAVFTIGFATSAGRYFDSSDQTTHLAIQSSSLDVTFSSTRKTQALSNDGLNNQYIWWVCRDTGIIRGRRNSTEYSTIGSGTVSGSAKFKTWGSGNQFFNGDIQEMIFYSAHKKDDAAAIITEINGFYFVF